MIFQFNSDILIDVLGHAARPATIDANTDRSNNSVLIALDVRGDATAKVVDAALTNAVEDHINDKVYLARLQNQCYGRLGFAVLDAFNLSLADGCQTVIEILQAVAQDDLWATIRREGSDNQPVRASVTQIGDGEFIGPVSDPELLPPSPGVLVLVDHVGGVDAPVAVESVANLRQSAADHEILRKHQGQFYGEPGFAWRSLSEAEADQREEVAKETARLLLETGTAI